MIYLAMAAVPAIVFVILSTLLSFAGYSTVEMTSILESFDAFIFSVIFYVIGRVHGGG